MTATISRYRAIRRRKCVACREMRYAPVARESGFNEKGHPEAIEGRIPSLRALLNAPPKAGPCLASPGLPSPAPRTAAPSFGFAPPPTDCGSAQQCAWRRLALLRL